MAAPPTLPDDTYVHKMTDIENDAAFPFDDMILSGNVIPGSILQNLMPPLQVHMNLNYPYETHKQTNSSDSENENKPEEPKHNTNNIFPPTLSRRIEMAETRKKKKKKKEKEKNQNDSDSEDEKTDIFRTIPSKKKPLDTMCGRSLELEHGWKQVLFPGLQKSFKNFISNYLHTNAFCRMLRDSTTLFVDPSARPSVRHCSCPNDKATSNMALAYQHAT